MTNDPAIAPEVEPLLDLATVAQITGKSLPFLRAEITAGRLRAIRLGISIRVRPGDLVAYLDAAPVALGPDPRRDGRRNGLRPGRPRREAASA